MKKKKTHLSVQYPYPSPILEGSVLILSLWVIVLLTFFALSLSYGIRQKVSLVERLEEKRRLMYLAQAGINKAISFLKKQDFSGYLGLNSNLINNPEEFKDIDFGKDYLTFAYDFRDDFKKEYSTFFGFQDEAGKININKIDKDTLKRLFILLNLDEPKAEEISSSIVDWRDSDNELTSTYSAESSYYQFLEQGYPAKNSDFEVWEELLLVKGIDKDTFSRIKDYLTVYGDGKININTASSVVLLALGLSPSLVDKIISWRQGDDKISGTSDDNNFMNTQEIVTRLSQTYNLSEQEINQLSQISKDFFTVDSHFFSIECKAYTKTKDKNLMIKAVLDKEGKVFYWRQI